MSDDAQRALQQMAEDLQQPSDQQVALARKVFLPITSAPDFISTMLAEAAATAVGLGSAVGIWSVINKLVLAATNSENAANWVSGIGFGLVLAPVLSKAARLLFAKILGVLKQPLFEGWEKVVDKLAFIVAGTFGVGGIQGAKDEILEFKKEMMGLKTLLGVEYVSFVLGFFLLSCIKTVLVTVLLRHIHLRERVDMPWKNYFKQVAREYMEGFASIAAFVKEELRDVLAFALYPYIGACWMGYWVGATKDVLWLGSWINLFFFFDEFTIVEALADAAAAWFPAAAEPTRAVEE